MVGSPTTAPEDIDVGAGLKAWLVACLAVSGAVSLFFGMINLALAPLAPFIFVIALVMTMTVTGIPAVLLVNLARGAGWPRGYADVCIPACISLLVGAVVTGGQPATLILAPLGALGGWVYWYTAGKPETSHRRYGEQP